MSPDSDGRAGTEAVLCYVCGQEPATVSWEAGDECRRLCGRCFAEVPGILREPKPKRRRRAAAAATPAPTTTNRARKPAPPRRIGADPADVGAMARPRFATDLDAPYSTTADGRNPWPEIWGRQVEAGDVGYLHPDCIAAGHEWLLRHRQSAAPATWGFGD